MHTPVEATERGGFFWCGHCCHVVEPSERQLDVFENAPAGSLATLKCPRCRRWEMRYKQPKPEKPKPWGWRNTLVPVSVERAAELFSGIRLSLESLPTD